MAKPVMGAARYPRMGDTMRDPLGESRGTVREGQDEKASAVCAVLPKNKSPAEGGDQGQSTVARCIAMLYNQPVIKNFVHKGIERFFLSGSKAGIQPQHAKRLRLQLERLHRAATPQDMNLPNWRLHALKGNLSGHWAVWVDGNWRVTFSFDGEDAILVDYQDYH